MPERLNSFFVRRRTAPPAAEPVEAVEIPERSLPAEADATDLRRERRALALKREVEIRDVGGLAVEMVRRDRWKPELLISRAGDVLSVERRIHELDSLLSAEMTARTFPHVGSCKCGAPLLPGVHFCSHCGRAAPTAPAVATCGHCGQPLPADANFCSFCGNSAAAQEYEPALAPLEETVVRPSSLDEPESRL